MRRARWFVLPLVIALVLLPGVPAMAITDGSLTVVPSTSTPNLGANFTLDYSFTQGGSPTASDVYTIVSFAANSRAVTWDIVSCTAPSSFTCGGNGDTIVFAWLGGLSASQTVTGTATITVLTTSTVSATAQWAYSAGGSYGALPGTIAINAVSPNNVSVVVAASSVALSRVVNYTVTVTKVAGATASGRAIVAFPTAFPSISGDCAILGRIVTCVFTGLSTSIVYNFTGTVDALYTGVFSGQSIITDLNNFDNTLSDNQSTKNCTAVSALVITC